MNLEQSEYTINNSTIFIHWNINKPINLSLPNNKFTRLVFSNYDDIDICIRTNNKLICDDVKINRNKYKKSLFNNSIIFNDNLTHLTHLTFGYFFNKQVILPQNLVYLLFENYFNQPITINNSLVHLIFGEYFNQPIIIPNSLTHLTLGWNYNQSIELTKNLIYLSLGYKYTQKCDLANIKHLKINCNNIHLIDNLPNSLEILTLGKNFNLPLENLPNSIKLIEIFNGYDKPIKNVSKNLQINKL